MGSKISWMEFQMRLTKNMIQITELVKSNIQKNHRNELLNEDKYTSLSKVYFPTDKKQKPQL
jgi:hypothetical protein